MEHQQKRALIIRAALNKLEQTTNAAMKHMLSTLASLVLLCGVSRPLCFLMCHRSGQADFAFKAQVRTKRQCIQEKRLEKSTQDSIVLAKRSAHGKVFILSSQHCA